MDSSSEILAYVPYVIDGTVTTVLLSLFAWALAVIIGLLGAFGRIAGPGSVVAVIQVYTVIFRGIPDIVWVFLIFFGGQAMYQSLWAAVGFEGLPQLDPFTAGVFAIGLSHGAYMIETFRSAALAIHKGQIEAAVSYGLGLPRILWRVVGPQLFRNSFAGVQNNWLGLIKSSAVVSVLGLHDLVSNARAAGRASDQPFTFLMVSLVIYLIFSAVTEAFMGYLNARNLKGGWSR